jgi:FtsZ-interacting cell division protein ZipA
VDIPKVDIPKVDIPKVDIPKVDIPKVDIPKVDIPKVDIPKVDIPLQTSAPVSQQRSWGWLFALLVIMAIIGAVLGILWYYIYGAGSENRLFQQHYTNAVTQTKHCESTGKCVDALGVANQAKNSAETMEEHRKVDSLLAKIKRKQEEVKGRGLLNAPEPTDKGKDDLVKGGISKTATPPSPKNGQPTANPKTTAPTPKTTASSKTSSTTASSTSTETSVTPPTTTKTTEAVKPPQTTSTTIKSSATSPTTSKPVTTATTTLKPSGATTTSKPQTTTPSSTASTK